MSRFLWEHLSEQQRGLEDAKSTHRQRAAAIYDSLIPHAKSVIDDPAQFKSVRAPRRSSKSYTETGYGLILGESTPGTRVLVIGLTLKSAKENFWNSAPGGVQAFDTRFQLGLTFSYQDISWKHQNGSIGFLAGAGSADDLEKLRGSKVEADLIIIDECKSFSPDRLRELITEILMPGLMTRGGTLLLAGTPGSICSGVFYEATCPASQFKDKSPTCIPWSLRDSPALAAYVSKGDEDDETRWSHHNWTIQDNTSNPKQWARALKIKKMNGWDDDHPTWRREFLAEWVEDSSEMVYSYLANRGSGKCSWVPEVVGPQPGDDWSYLVGIDPGYEDESAFSVAAYNRREETLYHIETYKQAHMTVDDVRDYAIGLVARYNPDIAVFDSGNLGKMIMETLSAHGLPMVAADKSNKLDYIELLNADIKSGRVKIAEGSELHHEMLALTWDLSRGTRTFLARTRQLKENPHQANHACDSFLYLWRWARARFNPVVTDIASADETNQERINREVAAHMKKKQAVKKTVGRFRTDHLIKRSQFRN